MVGVFKPNCLGKQVIASSLGSFTTVLTLNPLSVLKVRLQSSSNLQEGASGALYKEVQSVYNSRGVRGFWSGTSTGLVMSIPSTVIYMSSYERSKAVLVDSMFVSPLIAPALAGATARLISVSVVSPMELIRTIQQLNFNVKQQSFMQIARDTVRTQGYRGLYRGWSSTVLRDCPFSAIYWFAFERFKPLYNKHNVNNQDSSISTFLSGSTAGLIAAAITHPFDVIKTKQQSLPSISTTTMQSSSVPSFSLGNILKVEGIAGLYRGLGLRMFTVIPSCGILITVYEAVKAIDFD